MKQIHILRVSLLAVVVALIAMIWFNLQYRHIVDTQREIIEDLEQTIEIMEYMDQYEYTPEDSLVDEANSYNINL